jgi:hypothetical protein
MSWYRAVIKKLKQAGIFAEVNIVGAKVRAAIDETNYNRRQLWAKWFLHPFKGQLML